MTRRFAVVGVVVALLVGGVAAPAGGGAGLLCPVAGPTLFSNSYRFRKPDGRVHRAVDLYAARGTPVVAVEAGFVEYDSNRLGGLVVRVYADGRLYYYAHLEGWADGLGVGDGDWVLPGWVLGFVGTTGNAAGTSPHLHFSVRSGGRFVNPYGDLVGVCGGVSSIGRVRLEPG